MPAVATWVALVDLVRLGDHEGVNLCAVGEAVVRRFSSNGQADMEKYH